MSSSSSSSLPGVGFTLNSLAKASRNQERAFEKLSSGLRINRASDDAAGLAIANSLEASIASLGVARRNIADVTSITQIADGAIEQLANISIRQQELATQSSNGTLSDDQRTSLNQEFQALSQEANRIVSTTEFNGVNVFQTQITGQVGTDSSANSQITIANVNVSSLVSSLSSQSIGTASSASTALTAVQDFTKTLSARRGELGASQARLETAEQGVANRSVNESEALSRIRDDDTASTLAEKIRNDILKNTGTAVLAQARLSADSVKQLLG